MACVYILYADSIDRFYIGSCLDFKVRFKKHIKSRFQNAYTAKAQDWNLFYKIDGLEYSCARKIELHIKKMKSRKYYHDLRKHQDIMKKLIEKYSTGSSR